MRFSELYSVRRADEDDWFDTYLPADTRLFVDPFLIYDDTDPFWRAAHDHILDFFARTLSLVAAAKGDEMSLPWQQARGMLLFPEPPEFCLGHAKETPDGSGSGDGLQQGMLAGAKTAVGLGIEDIEHMEMLILFQGGVGLDRISDAVCNILKSYFIRYTQIVCQRHNIPMQRFRVKNASWDEDGARWQTREVELPVNSCLTRVRPVLLVPERFLKDIPVASPDAFWDYAWENKGADLRRDFNYDLATKVPRRIKARLARQHPELAISYLAELEGAARSPYPVVADPKGLVRWYESGAVIAERSPLSFLPAGPDDFPKFVFAVVEAFSHYVEHQAGWELLWNGRSHRSERSAQQLFRGSAIHYCRANDIDLTGEANAGRGPVDFKFSKTWSARAVVEMKLVQNAAFWDGILAQTPTYALAEEVKAAIFAAIAFTDDEMKTERLDKTRRAAEIASKPGQVHIVPVVIDARPKQSASKLKASQETRDDLHERKRTRKRGTGPA